MRDVVARTEEALPPGAWPCWIGSNHDVRRFTTRWCGADEGLARCALLMLVTLRGAPSLYYGDELALPDGHVPPERVRDVAEPSRDPCRTPMPWSRGGGWTDPWLPLADTSRNVEDQRADPASTLHFTRDLIALRKTLADLRSGAYLELPSPPDAWVWRRGEGTVVAINLGQTAVEIAVSRARSSWPHAVSARESASRGPFGSSPPKASSSRRWPTPTTSPGASRSSRAARAGSAQPSRSGWRVAGRRS